MSGRSRRSRRIDLNRATADDLANISGIGKGKAIEIVDMREALGGFSTVDDLRSIRGIGSGFLDTNKELFYCSPQSKIHIDLKSSSSRDERSNSRCSLRNRLSDIECRGDDTIPLKRKSSQKPEIAVPEKRLCPEGGNESDSCDGTNTIPQQHTNSFACPPEMEDWLQVFNTWAQDQKKRALDELMERCNPPIIRHVMSSIEPRFQRDFISLLPNELAFYVLGFLGPKDLVQAAQTCKYWRILCDDNL